MKDISDIKKDLIESCRKLHNNGTINSDSYYNCEDSFKDKINMDIFDETYIFGEERKVKNDVYFDLIKKIRIYNNRDNLDTNNQTIIIQQLKIILEELNRIILERHSSPEEIEFNRLLDYYKKIENNRDKLSNINKETIDLQNNIYNLKVSDSKYILRLVVLIIMILIFIVLLIIYIKF